MAERDTSQEHALFREAERNKPINFNNQDELLRFVKNVNERVERVRQGGHEITDDDFKSAVETQVYVDSGKGEEAIERAQEQITESTPDIESRDSTSSTIH